MRTHLRIFVCLSILANVTAFGLTSHRVRLIIHVWRHHTLSGKKAISLKVSPTSILWEDGGNAKRKIHSICRLGWLSPLLAIEIILILYNMVYAIWIVRLKGARSQSPPKDPHTIITASQNRRMCQPVAVLLEMQQRHCRGCLPNRHAGRLAGEKIGDCLNCFCTVSTDVFFLNPPNKISAQALRLIRISIDPYYYFGPVPDRSCQNISH